MSGNSKGELGDFLLDNVVFLILLVVFFSGMLYFILQQQEGASVWEEYYAKEIVKIIDFSERGDKACMDVHKATEIAKKNNIASFSEIFRFDNSANEICVKLSRGRKTCFNYFNELDVVNLDLRLGVPGNVLCFDIVDSNRGADNEK